MKLLTINTHSLVEEHYELKKQQFAENIVRLQPDIIAMQEVNQSIAAGRADAFLQQGRYLNHQEQQPLRSDNHAAQTAAELRSAGLAYSWCWLPMKLGYGKYDEGLAVFSRQPVEEADVVLLSSSGDYHSWRTRYALGIRPAGSRDWFYSVHLGWWQDEAEPFRMQWQRLSQAVQSKKERGRVFLLGDFNSPAQVRHEGYDLLTASGWHDIYLLAKKRDEGITVRGVIDGWRDKLSEQSMCRGMRIDHIWCSEKVMAAESLSCFNGKNGPVISDHFGLWAEVEDGSK